MIGEKVLSYQIESLLGEGGVGSVYLATHTQLGRKVAIKVLNPALVNHTEVRERFRNEATTLSSLQHINIITLYDYMEDERGLFLIMEYAPGSSLDDYIRKTSGPIPESKAIYFFTQILDGFAYAHSRSVIHRDIKPSNIIITNDADVKILDFGIAKILKEGKMSMTKTGAKLGTVLYMSPEQVKGQSVDIRTDIYSLGVTLFEMLTGRCPYDGNLLSEYEVYQKIVQEPLPAAKSFYPAVSDRMQAIIHKATAKDPKDRFQSCEEFKIALNQSDFAYQNNFKNTDTTFQTPKPSYTDTPKENKTPQTKKPQNDAIPAKRARNNTFLYVILSLLFFVSVSVVIYELTREKNSQEAISNTQTKLHRYTQRKQNPSNQKASK
jgi:serine/threonine protein kinase